MVFCWVGLGFDLVKFYCGSLIYNYWRVVWLFVDIYWLRSIYSFVFSVVILVIYLVSWFLKFFVY